MLFKKRISFQEGLSEMKVEILPTYNEKEVKDLHNKIIEVSDQIQYEEHPAAKDALVRLMEVYINAIETILNRNNPFMAVTDLGGEASHFEDFKEMLRSSKEDEE